jgi:hypothetical protein
VTTFPLTTALPTTEAPAHPRLDSLSADFDGRVREFLESFPSPRPFQLWLIQQIAHNAIIADQCRVEAAFHRERLMKRAQLFWNDDRRLEAEEIANRLPKRPSQTMKRLQKTRQGCEWLLERWDCLAQLSREQGEWTLEQETLARDMLGIPLELRNVPCLLDGATPEETRAARLRVAEKEIARLLRRIEERLDSLDTMEQTAAIRGQSLPPDKDLRACQRLEATANRRIQWALDRLLSLPENPTAARIGHSYISTTPAQSEADYRAFIERMDSKPLERKPDIVTPPPAPSVSAPIVMATSPSLASAGRPERPMSRQERRAMKARKGR